MFNKLTIDEILNLLSCTPEQAAFDWKRDFSVQNDDAKKGEIIKDICAIANASPLSYGYIFYGVDPQQLDPIIGISGHYDDANLQQLIRGKVEPLPEFLYYEVPKMNKTIAVIQIAPNKKRPFIITTDIGKIRRGSSTDGITINDLFEFFYGSTSAYFPIIAKQAGLDIQRQQAQNEYLKELQIGTEQAEDEIFRAAGFIGKPRR